MDIKDLQHIEQLALTGLLVVMSGADGVGSDAETDAVSAIVRELGSETFAQLRQEFDTGSADADSRRRLFAQVERQEARELIYQTVLDVAMADGIEGRESKLLEWLEETWDIVIEPAITQETDR